MRTRFFQILHLLITVDICKRLYIDFELKELDKDEWLELLDDDCMDIEYLIKSIVPGPCLVYLHALKLSKLDEKTKMGDLLECICKINSIILDYFKNQQFGILGNLVIYMAIQEYDRLAKICNIKEYIEFIDKYRLDPNISEQFKMINEKLSVLDKCILYMLKHLDFMDDIDFGKIGIGQLNNHNL